MSKKVFIDLDLGSNSGIDNMTEGSGLQSATNVDQVNTALSGHTDITSGIHGTSSAVVGVTDSQDLYNKTLVAPVLSGAVGSYFERTYDIADLNAGLTNLTLQESGNSTLLYRSVLGRSAILTNITINVVHADAGPPSSWDFQVHKNGSKAASMNFVINGSTLAQSVTNGTPHPSRVSFDPTDLMHFTISGAAFDSVVCKATLGFETNE